MELSFDELNSFVRDICAGQKIVSIEDSSKEENLLIFKFPSLEDYQISESVYNKAYQEAKKEGLLSVEEMKKIVEERKLFSDADQEELDKLNEKIKAQKVVLAKTTRVRARRDRVIKIINDLENEAALIRVKKDKNFEFTCERKATEQKYLYLVWNNTLEPYTKLPYWSTYNKFKNELDFVFRRKVYLEYIIYTHGLPIKTLRYIARSNYWRIYYVTATKTGDRLFNRPIAEYTADQTMLLYWSHYYQSIYEMLPADRPGDSIIEDDEALDAFMKDWQAERNRDSAASRGKKDRSKTAWDHGETLVMRSNEMYEDIDYNEPPGSMAKNKAKKDLDAAPTNKTKLRKRQARENVKRFLKG